MTACLDRIMRHIHQDTFGGREAPVVCLSDGTTVGEDGTITGNLEVTVLTRTGESRLLHTQSLDGISDETSLKDAFAEALSTVLSRHTKWPR